ncbi:MAG: iron-sulfur cluster assembly scaffold protein [Pseudomonadota bacterium]
MSAVTQDLMKLYSQRILALAGDIPRIGRLEAPDGTATKRSPLCGSTVTVDVAVADGRVADYAHDVKACALGQSSASVLGTAVVGLSRDDIAKGRDALTAMLKKGGPVPDQPFHALEALLPAKDYKNRHASILLTWDAVLAAIEDAERGESGPKP